MSNRVVQTEELKSQTGIILAVDENRYALDPTLLLADLLGNQCVTKDMLSEAPTSSIVINLDAGDSAQFDYIYPGDVTDEGLFIYAETFFTHPTYGVTIVPYDLQYFKIPSTNHIILQRSDINDIVKVTIKP